jgi:hypothetical protein
MDRCGMYGTLSMRCDAMGWRGSDHAMPCHAMPCHPSTGGGWRMRLTTDIINVRSPPPRFSYPTIRNPWDGCIHHSIPSSGPHVISHIPSASHNQLDNYHTLNTSNLYAVALNGSTTTPVVLRSAGLILSAPAITTVHNHSHTYLREHFHSKWRIRWL